MIGKDNKVNFNKKKIAVIGLGYVGLPIALEFSKVRSVIGFDINAERIAQLKDGVDATCEVSQGELKDLSKILFTSNHDDLVSPEIYIIAVPTPVDSSNRPDFRPLISATKTVGRVLKKNDIVIFESTVYPGATEEICIPILERESTLVGNVDFFFGYSPERANPGDKINTIKTITKVTSGSNPDIASEIDNLYREIVIAGTHSVSSIKVAEACKIIENIQRDVNIALINELSIICGKLGIDTHEVLRAAETKWNFLSFRPGLVGGHCISVDPYYLTDKAEQIGYHPEIILAGRRLNDFMPIHVADETVKLMLKRKIRMDDSNILIMGFTFKENCPDIRNTKVYDIYSTLKSYGLNVDVYDPWADKTEVFREYSIEVETNKEKLIRKYSAVIVAVGHTEFRDQGLFSIKDLCYETHVIYDVKGIYSRELVDGRL